MTIYQVLKLEIVFQVFLIHPPVPYELGDVIEGEVDITRAKENHRLMDLKFRHRLIRSKTGAASPVTCSDFYLE